MHTAGLKFCARSFKVLDKLIKATKFGNKTKSLRREFKFLSRVIVSFILMNIIFLQIFKQTLCIRIILLSFKK